jgi:hypothetical protein
MMRGYELLLMASLVLAGCHSGPNLASHAMLPPSTLGSIPSPSQLDAGVPGTGQASGTKQASSLNRVLGADYSDELANAHVARHAATYSCALAGEPDSIAFCIFELNPGILSEDGLISAVLVESEWAAQLPATPDGLWVGVPDYIRDRWTWLGPVSDEAVWLDLTSYALRGRPGANHLAVVNCAPSTVELYALNIQSAVAVPDLESSWLYYTRYDEENPALGTSIIRIQPGLAGPPEVVLQGTASESYFYPRIRFTYSTGDSYLVYALNSGGDNEVWSANLDGTNPQPLCQDAGVNYLPGAFDSYTDNSTYLEQNAQGRYNLFAVDGESGTASLLTRLQDHILHVTWDNSTACNYAVIYSLRVDGPPVRSVIAYSQAWNPPPFEYEPDVLIDNGMESAIMPSYFEIIDSLGQPLPNIVFCSRGRAGNRFALYWYAWRGDLIDDGILHTIAVVPDSDLLSPSVSPRGKWLAYVATEPGVDRGVLNLTDFLSITNPASDAVTLDVQVTGQVVWARDQ